METCINIRTLNAADETHLELPWKHTHTPYSHDCQRNTDRD